MPRANFLFKVLGRIQESYARRLSMSVYQDLLGQFGASRIPVLSSAQFSEGGEAESAVQGRHKLA